jgi:hypothetical protein
MRDKDAQTLGSTASCIDRTPVFFAIGESRQARQGDGSDLMASNMTGQSLWKALIKNHLLVRSCYGLTTSLLVLKVLYERAWVRLE